MNNKVPKYKSWVRLVAISAFCSLPPFSFFMGLLALFGFNTVAFNGEYLLGFAGLIVGTLGGLFMAGMMTVFAATFGFTGLLVYSKYRPISLEF